MHVIYDQNWYTISITYNSYTLQYITIQDFRIEWIFWIIKFIIKTTIQIRTKILLYEYI